MQKIFVTIILSLVTVFSVAQDSIKANRIIDQIGIETNLSKHIFKTGSIDNYNSYSLGISTLYEKSDLVSFGFEINSTIPGIAEPISINSNAFILIGNSNFVYKTGIGTSRAYFITYISGIKYYFIKQKFYLAFDYNLYFDNGFTYSHFLSNYIFGIGYKIK